MAQKDVGNKIPIYKLKTTEEVMKYYDEWGEKDKYNRSLGECYINGESLSVYMVGMVIAIVVTFLSLGNFSTGFIYVLIFLLAGGVVGAFGISEDICFIKIDVEGFDELLIYGMKNFFKNDPLY